MYQSHFSGCLPPQTHTICSAPYPTKIPKVFLPNSVYRIAVHEPAVQELSSLNGLAPWVVYGMSISISQVGESPNLHVSTIYLERPRNLSRVSVSSRESFQHGESSSHLKFKSCSIRAPRRSKARVSAN